MSDNQVFILVIGIPFYLVGCLAVYAFLKEQYNANFNGYLQPVYIICISMSVAFFPTALVLAVIAYMFVLLLDAFEYIFITSRKKGSSLNKDGDKSKDIDLKEFKIKSFKKL